VREELVVVVPSVRRRIEHAAMTARAFATAVAFVPEADVEFFEAHEPFAGRVVGHKVEDPHPAALFNAMLDAFRTPVVVHVPDSVTGAHVAEFTTRRMLYTRSPAVIAAVIANGAACAADLGLGAFGWPANTRWNKATESDPIALGQSPAYVWGLRGAGRLRRFDATENWLADFWRRTFAEDRLVWMDRRCAFDADAGYAERADVSVARRRDNSTTAYDALIGPVPTMKF